MTLPASHDELMEEVRSYSESQLDYIRELACNNLFFMAKGVVGYKDVNLHTHGAFCKFFEDDRYDRRMGLMPRLHLKTSIATECDSIRIACKTRGDARILIVNEILKNAQDIMGTIKAHFEQNELLRLLFAELIPERFSGPGVTWSSEGATLLRKMPYKEPTFMPLGVGGAAVSKHFTHIKKDDLIGLEAYQSPATMRRAIEWEDNSEALMVGEGLTWVDWIGTRWAKNDLYGHVIQQYGDRLRVFRRKIIENGERIFPERISWRQIELLKKKPMIYAAQYENDPLGDMALDFQYHLVREFRFDNEGDVVFEGGKWAREVLDVVLSVDPNSGSKTAEDEAAISAVAMAPDEKVFVLESFHGRPTPSEFIDRLFEMAKKWRPRVIGIEKAGQQNTRHYFEKKMHKERVLFRVEDLKPENKDKDERIRNALEPLISSRKFFVLPGSKALREQVKHFPNLDLKDVIDSVAYSIRLLKRPLDFEQHKRNRDAAKMILASRNTVTGW